jgi:hypothetical protein
LTALQHLFLEVLRVVGELPKRRSLRCVREVVEFILALVPAGAYSQFWHGFGKIAEDRISSSGRAQRMVATAKCDDPSLRQLG